MSELHAMDWKEEQRTKQPQRLAMFHDTVLNKKQTSLLDPIYNKIYCRLP